MAHQCHFANVVQSWNNETSDTAAMFRTVMARSMRPADATRPCRRLIAAVHAVMAHRRYRGIAGMDGPLLARTGRD